MKNLCLLFTGILIFNSTILPMQGPATNLDKINLAELSLLELDNLRNDSGFMKKHRAKVNREIFNRIGHPDHVADWNDQFHNPTLNYATVSFDRLLKFEAVIKYRLEWKISETSGEIITESQERLQLIKQAKQLHKERYQAQQKYRSSFFRFIGSLFGLGAGLTVSGIGLYTYFSGKLPFANENTPHATKMAAGFVTAGIPMSIYFGSEVKKQYQTK